MNELPEERHVYREREIPDMSGRGFAIGPALVYAATVISTPFVVWITLIVQRAFAGNTALETPYSAFAVLVAVSVLLFVEAMRARRKAIA